MTYVLFIFLDRTVFVDKVFLILVCNGLVLCILIGCQT